MIMERLLLPVVIPGAAGLLVLVLPGRYRNLRAAIGVLGAFGAMLAGAALLDVREALSRDWIHLGPLNLDFAFRVDGFSCWAVAFAGFIGFLAALYSTGWFRDRGGAPGRYYAYLLFATAGAAGVVLAGNLLLMVICWEIVTLSLFLLVATGKPEGALAAAKSFTIIGAGDMAILLAVILIGILHSGAGLAAPLSTSTLAANPVSTSDGLSVAIYLLLFMGAATKAGAIPFHSWIPTMAEGAHPPVMAVLPGSLDKVIGIYLLARITLDWFVVSPGVQLVVMLVGAVTILAGVLMAMVQHDLRRLLAFHAVSQVGYMILGIGTGTIVGVLGGIFHMLNNAIYKACLFFGAGVVEREAGTTDLHRLGGLGKALPVTFGCMFVAALAISGIPPLNGFVSKWLVYQGCVAAGQPVFLVVALFGSVLTLASFVKVLHSVFWGTRPREFEGVREDGVSLRLPMVTLATLCILLGVFAAWPLDHAIGPAVGLDPGGDLPGSATLVASSETWARVSGEPAAPDPGGVPRAVFRPVAVTGLLVLGVLAALLLAHVGPTRVRREQSVFIGGEPIDPDVNRFPGTEFYRTITDLPVLGKLLDAGEKGRFDLYGIFERLGGGVGAGLSRLHTGMITHYLLWCLLGLAAVLGVFFWT